MGALYSDVQAVAEALSPLEKELLKLAGKGLSAVEIGNKVNIPPEQAIIRVRELLSRRDVWSERERFALYLDDLYELKDWLQSEVRATGDPRAVANLIRALEQLGKTLTTAAELNRDAATIVTETQAKFLVGVIVTAFDYAKDALAEEYPDLPIEVIDRKFREGIALARG
jgi:hypothetical protein